MNTHKESATIVQKIFLGFRSTFFHQFQCKFYGFRIELLRVFEVFRYISTNLIMVYLMLNPLFVHFSLSFTPIADL